MFGEIDCREGLTMAVDKLKYETVDAAMDVLLHIYKGDAAHPGFVLQLCEFCQEVASLLFVFGHTSVLLLRS